MTDNLDPRVAVLAQIAAGSDGLVSGTERQ